MLSFPVKTMKKKLLAVLAALTVLCCGCGSENPAQKERFSSSFLDLFDTASTVVAYDDSQEAFDVHMKAFHQKLEEYHKLYDIYNTYDDMANLATVNARAMDGPVKVDEKIIDLLEYGREVYDMSGGKTNICFGAVLSLWHESRMYSEGNQSKAYIPVMEDLREAALHTNFDDLVVDREKGTVYFKDPKLRLDAGAIAKGFAVRETCAWAREYLWQSAAVSIGGNVVVFGYKNNDGKTLWNIGIEHPDQDTSENLETLSITDMSVVTSGDYQRYYTVDGRKYCHIIDPQTLMPADYSASVSVVCGDSALGDALSTALFNMPVEEGKSLVDAMEDVEAVWVDRDYNRTYSQGFQGYIKD